MESSSLSTVPQPAKPPRFGVLGVFRRFGELGVALVLVALVLTIGLAHPDFLASDVLLGTLRQAAFVAIVAYGLVFLLAMTEIDLSVGGIYAVTILVAAKLMAESGWNPWLAAFAAILLGAALGGVNGMLATAFRIPVIIVTLGTLSMYRGIVTVISNSQPVSGLPITTSFFDKAGNNLLGVPAAGWVVVILGVVLTVVFTRTRYGAMVRATGSNVQAARYMGIPTQRIRLYALIMVGALCGLSGVLSLAFFQGADPTIGVGFELQAIAAAIIGGTAVSGGTGTVPGALLGALIVAVINSGLVFFSVPANWSDFITGAVIVIAVGSDALIRRRRETRAAELGL